MQLKTHNDIKNKVSIFDAVKNFILKIMLDLVYLWEFFIILKFLDRKTIQEIANRDKVINI